jgi:hypothetical protein
MSTLLSIDPGIRGVGLAYFVGPRLVYANYVANPVTSGGGPAAWFAMADAVYSDLKVREYRVDHYVVELMQIYGGRGPGDPNDLLELAGVGSAIGAALPIKRATGWRPRTWKGQIPKAVHHPLILAQLEPDEVAAIVEKRKTYVEHVVDAIGIGLYQLERDSLRFKKRVER